MTSSKKGFIILLCLCLMFNTIYPIAFADTGALENVNSYYVGDCIKTNVPESIQYGDGKSGYGFGMYNGLYVQYDVNVENSGFYIVTADLSASGETGGVLNLFIDNILTKEVDIIYGGVRNVKTNSFGEIYLSSGDYSFKIMINGGGDIEFHKMDLEFLIGDDGRKVEFIYDSVYTPHTKGGSDAREETYPYTGMILGTNGSYAQYSVDVPAGNYVLSICYGAPESEGRAGVILNGGDETTYTLPANNTFIHQGTYDKKAYYELDIFALSEGINTIKFQCQLNEDKTAAAYFCFSTFKLTRIDTAAAKMFDEGNNEIFKLKDGDVKVKSYLPAYVEGNVVDMMACIYKDGVLDKMQIESIGQAEANTTAETVIENLSINKNSKYILKLFFWEGLSSLKPVCSEVILGDKIYKNIYISPNGDDTAQGNENAPFKTLKRAKEEIAKINDDMDGDVVVNILPGEYEILETEEFTSDHSGKNGGSIILRGTDYENMPVFSGGTKVSGWEKYNDYLWCAPLDTEADIRNLYINGFMAQKARSKYRYLPTVDYNIEGSGNINDGVGIIDVNFPKILSNPEDIELCWQNAWTMQITPVNNIERKDGMVYFIMDQPYYNIARSRTFLSTAPGANRRFHIQNAFELLDEPGEFYYNKKEKMIYYYPFKAENLNECETVVGTTELMFSVKGESRDETVKNIEFENIAIKYGAWNEVSKTGMIVDQADKIATTMYSGTGAGGKMIPAQFDVKNAEGIKIKNCEFSCLGSSAIAMSDGVKNSIVSGNKIHDISGSGVVIGHWDHNDNGNHPQCVNMTQCSDIDVVNNMITRVAYEFKGCIGISVYYEKNINILHNYIKDTAYSGITVGWGWGEEADTDNIKVSYNLVENAVMPPVLDGGHIYTLGPLRNSEISYNYFKDTEGEYGAIYPDSGSSYLEIHHNVVEGCDHWFFGGLYETHDINAYDNFSDTEKYFDYGATDEYEGENTIEKINLIDVLKRPKEAETIITNAGLEEAYIHLCDDAIYPDWRKDFAKDAPSESFTINDGTWYQAEDFLEGGQGVGYYKLRPMGNNTVYREGDVIMHRQEDDGSVLVGDTYPGEWLMYDITIPYDGKYQLTVKGSYVPYTADEAPALVNIYVDDEKIVNGAEISVTESWGIKLPNVLGEYDFTKGNHKLKVEFVQMGFAFDAFRIIDVEKVGLPEVTSPDYDEGVIVIEN